MLMRPYALFLEKQAVTIMADSGQELFPGIGYTAHRVQK